MSTDTRHPQYDDATLQATIDEACQEVANGPHRPMGAELELSTKDTEVWPLEAKARLSLLKTALARLPEPLPPVVDGKTPGQVAFEAWAPSYIWEAAKQEDWHLAASAVLAAFGGGSECYRIKPQPETFEAHGKTWTPSVGDVVRLKSGGPKMTVLELHVSGKLICNYFGDVGGLCTAYFPPETLTPAE